MIRKLAPYTKGYRVYILLGILCSAGEAVLELMLPKAMSNIVDYGIGGNGGAGDRTYILTMGLKMVLMALICLALGVGAAALAAKAGMGFGANVRDAEYRQVQRFSFSNIEHFSTASLITRLTNDVSSVQMTLMMGMRMVMDRSLRQYGVTPVQCRALMYLHRQPEPVTQRQLEQYMAVKPSTINGIVGRLEEKGLLTRDACQQDARWPSAPSSGPW